MEVVTIPKRKSKNIYQGVLVACWLKRWPAIAGSSPTRVRLFLAYEYTQLYPQK